MQFVYRLGDAEVATVRAMSLAAALGRAAHNANMVFGVGAA
jgi:hypothetical protein